jgi:hypothetical protein
MLGKPPGVCLRNPNQVVAYYDNVNRVADSLGVELEPD